MWLVRDMPLAEVLASVVWLKLVFRRCGARGDGAEDRRRTSHGGEPKHHWLVTLMSLCGGVGCWLGWIRWECGGVVEAGVEAAWLKCGLGLRG